MACSNPLHLTKEFIKKNGSSRSHVDFETLAFRRSFGERNYIEIPCNWCLNCRIDKQSQLIDRAEYEYIKYGCGAFVTFTYDDYHLFQNSFIDSHSGKTIATINKKDGKDFLNRLNKIVHKESQRLAKLKIDNKLCRPDYKYLIAYEYGDQFERPHIHCLFFGLDFAYCERLFWNAWSCQGSIQVGAIKNGGIAYATKYISEQTFGTDAFYKYDYHHLQRPSSSHSLNFGNGLFESQKKFIKETGCYKWHNITRPAPSYIKNKYHVIKDMSPEVAGKRFQAKKQSIKSLYDVDITSFKKYRDFALAQAKIIQNNAMIRLQQKGKQVYNSDKIALERFNTIYGKQKRLDPIFDNFPIRIINNQFKTFVKFIPDHKRIDAVPF